VGGDAGQQQIHHFASGVSTANGHVTPSDVLFSGNLDSVEVGARQYDLLQNYSFSASTYWYRSVGQSNPSYPWCEQNPPQMSPNDTFIDIAQVRDQPAPSDEIKIHGIFFLGSTSLPGDVYRARFTFRAMTKAFDPGEHFVGLFAGDLDEPLIAANSTTCRCKNDKGEFMILWTLAKWFLALLTSSLDHRHPFVFLRQIGLIVDSTLSFDAAKTDTVVDIYLGLTVRMDLQKHDAITLSLPGFQGPTGNFSADLDSGHTFASWSNATETLVFVVPLFIPRKTNFTAYLSSVHGVRLPVIGLQANQLIPPNPASSRRKGR
jgi:hypothetical protein